MFKKIIITFIITFFSISNSSGQFVNSGFESGNFTNWTGYTFSTSTTTIPGTLDLPAAIPGLVTPTNHDITTSGNFDPWIGGTLLPVTAIGNNAARLGSAGVGGKQQILSYTFTVTPQIARFSFQYALVGLDVSNDPSAHPTIQHFPYFSYWVSKTNNLITSNQPGNLVANTSNQIFFAGSNPDFIHPEGHSSSTLIYTKWKTICLDLNEYLGQTLTVYFAVSDCHPGMHYCYAYIDGLCTDNPPTANFTYPSTVCNPSAFMVEDDNSMNYTDYSWTLEKLSTNNINSVIPGTSISRYLSGSITPLNIAAMYQVGQELTTGYYKLTLGVVNCMGIWIYKSVVVKVEFPHINVLNGYVCCNDYNPSGTIQINADIGIVPGDPLGTVSWFDENNYYIGSGSSNSSGGILSASLTVPTTHSYKKYKVRYSTASGCTNEKDVFAVFIPNFWSVAIQQECNPNTCDKKLWVLPRYDPACIDENMTTAQAEEWSEHVKASLKYSWGNGSTASQIQVNHNLSKYVAECDVTWPCGSQHLTDTVFTHHNSLSDITWTTVANDNSYFRFFGVGGNYNATWYDLKIYDRWGNRCYHKYENPGCGFVQGGIYWDLLPYDCSVMFNNKGRSDWDVDTYHFVLEIGNCSTSDMISDTFEIIY